MANLKRVTFTLICIVTVILLMPGAALAADLLFLKLTGIPGESTDAEHQGEIVLVAYTQSFTNPGGRGAAPANCGAITVMKAIDRSSPALIGAVMGGTRIPDGLITFRKAGEQPFEYYKVTLKDVFINAITQTDTSGTDPATILEQISMNANTINFEYTPQLPGGGAGDRVSFGWNCLTNRAQ